MEDYGTKSRYAICRPALISKSCNKKIQWKLTRANHDLPAASRGCRAQMEALELGRLMQMSAPCALTWASSAVKVHGRASSQGRKSHVEVDVPIKRYSQGCLSSGRRGLLPHTP